MTINKPPIPNFSIKIEDKPIEMDKTIKQMIAQRNYDIEMINKNTELQVKENIKDKTNIEFIKEVNNFHENITSEKKILKIYEPTLSDEIYKNKIIDLNKHITWKDELDKNKTNTDIDINIFEKLKKVDLNKEIITMQNNINYLNDKITDMDANIKKILDKLNKIE